MQSEANDEFVNNLAACTSTCDALKGHSAAGMYFKLGSSAYMPPWRLAEHIIQSNVT